MSRVAGRLISLALRRRLIIKNSTTIANRQFFRRYCTNLKESENLTKLNDSSAKSVQEQIRIQPVLELTKFLTERIADGDRRVKWMNYYSLLRIRLDNKSAFEDPKILLKGLFGARLWSKDSEFISKVFDPWWILISNEITKNNFDVENICEMISLLGDMNVSSNSLRRNDRFLNRGKINLLVSKVLEADFSNLPPRALTFLFNGLQRLQTSADGEDFIPKELIKKTVDWLNSIQKDDVRFEDASTHGVFILYSLAKSGYALNHKSLKTFLSSSKSLFERISTVDGDDLKYYIAFKKFVLAQNLFIQTFLKWQINADDIVADVWRNWFEASKNLLTLSSKFETLQEFDLQDQTERNTFIDTDNFDTDVIRKSNHKQIFASELIQLCASAMDAASRFNKLDSFTINEGFKTVWKETLEKSVHNANPDYVGRLYSSLRTLQTILKAKSPSDDQFTLVGSDLLDAIKSKVEEGNKLLTAQRINNENVEKLSLVSNSRPQLLDDDSVSRERRIESSVDPSPRYQSSVPPTNRRVRSNRDLVQPEDQQMNERNYEDSDRFNMRRDNMSGYGQDNFADIRRSEPQGQYRTPNLRFQSDRGLVRPEDQTINRNVEDSARLSNINMRERGDRNNLSRYERQENLKDLRRHAAQNQTSSSVSNRRSSREDSARFNDRNLRDNDVPRYEMQENFDVRRRSEPQSQYATSRSASNLRLNSNQILVRPEDPMNYKNLANSDRLNDRYSRDDSIGDDISNHERRDNSYNRQERSADLGRSESMSQKKQTLSIRASNIRPRTSQTTNRMEGRYMARDNLSAYERQQIPTDNQSRINRRIGDDPSRIGGWRDENLEQIPARLGSSSGLRRHDVITDNPRYSPPSPRVSSNRRSQVKKINVNEEDAAKNTIFDETSIDAASKRMQNLESLPFSRGKTNSNVDSWMEEFERDFQDKFQNVDVKEENRLESDNNDAVDESKDADDSKEVDGSKEADIKEKSAFS